MHALCGLRSRIACRRPREIVRINRKGGPERVIDAIEARAPDGFTDIDAVLPYEERKAIVRGYAATAGFAREQVNRAPANAAARTAPPAR